MIAQCKHHIVEFFERDESASVSDLVIINGVGEFSDFGTQSAIAVSELSAFDAGWVLITGILSAFDEANG